MDNYYKKRFEINPNKPISSKVGKANTIEIKLYYDLGGLSYFTSETKPRGLYLSISPLTVSDKWTEYIAFSGKGGCVKQLNRKSEAKGQKVAMLIKEEVAKEMADAFQEGNDIKVLEIFNNIKTLAETV